MAARKPKRPRCSTDEATDLVLRAYRLLEGRPYLQGLARQMVEELLQEDEKPRRRKPRARVSPIRGRARRKTGA
jgi:hypothetical protein